MEKIVIPFRFIQELLQQKPGAQFDLDIELHNSNGRISKAKMVVRKKDFAVLEFEEPREERVQPAERWAYAPGVTLEDIAKAKEKNRAENSSSPIHLVANQIMEGRIKGE
jgi:hypothetical protein